MSKISVIIPVYNVEKYLKECLDSICNQSLTDIEIICVNDGSTDDSLEILNEYALKDDRIRIITQENQGLGAARNIGFSHATGDYIYFIDSDDYIEIDTLEKLYNNIISNDSDIVLFKFRPVDDFKNVLSGNVEFRIDEIFGDINYNNFTFTYNDARRHVMNSAFSACLKLYKYEFLKKIDFTFPIDLHFEDVPVHVTVMLEADKISFVPEQLYNYRSNPDSIINSTNNVFDIFKVIDMVEEYLKENDFYDDLKNDFILFKISQILLYLKNQNSEEYFKRTKDEFEKITINDEKILKKYAVGYRRVLNSNNILEYNSKIHSGKSKKKRESLFDKLIKFIKRYFVA